MFWERPNYLANGTTATPETTRLTPCADLSDDIVPAGNSGKNPDQQGVNASGLAMETARKLALNRTCVELAEQSETKLLITMNLTLELRPQITAQRLFVGLERVVSCHFAFFLRFIDIPIYWRNIHAIAQIIISFMSFAGNNYDAAKIDHRIELIFYI